MPAPDYLSAHGAGWKYQRPVPRKLRPAVGAAYWRKYLGQMSRAEARIKSRPMVVEHDALIAQLSKFSPADLQVIAEGGGVVEFATNYDTTVVAQDVFKELMESFQHKSDTEGHNWSDVQLSRYLEARRFITGVLHEANEHVRTAKSTRRKLGKVKGEAPERGLVALVNVWQDMTQPSAPVSVGQKLLYARRFIECVGDPPVAEIKREHVEQFRDWLMSQERLSHVTREKHLHALHSLLNVAIEKGWVKVNHAHGVKLRAPKGKHFDRKNKRKPFTPEQVKLILSKVGSSFGDRSADVEWVVKLAAYHGFRITEACQLRKGDVVKVHGVMVLRIHDEVGRVKNSSSVRDVPLHPKCADFVKYAANSPSDWVFDTLPMTKMGRGHWLSGEFGHFLRKVCKIEDRKLTFHSFRHRWNDMAREVEMPIEIRHALLGHTLGKGENFSYGAGVPMAQKAKWIKKIDSLT